MAIKLYDLIVMARNNSHPDPVVSSVDCHKIGDIVAIQPAGYAWSPNEQDSTVFSIIKNFPIEDTVKPFLDSESLKPLPLGIASRPELLAGFDHSTRGRATKRRYKFAGGQIIDKETDIAI